MEAVANSQIACAMKSSSFNVKSKNGKKSQYPWNSHNKVLTNKEENEGGFDNHLHFYALTGRSHCEVDQRNGIISKKNTFEIYVNDMKFEDDVLVIIPRSDVCTWETPVLALYQYVLPSSVLCSDHTEAATGFAMGAWTCAGYPVYACCRDTKKKKLGRIRIIKEYDGWVLQRDKW